MKKIKLDLAHKSPEEILALYDVDAAPHAVDPLLPNGAAHLAPLTAAIYIARPLIGDVELKRAALADAIAARDVAMPAVLRTFNAYAAGVTTDALLQTTPELIDAALVASHLPLAADRQSPQPLPQVTQLALTGGDNDAELDAMWKRIINASGYEIQITLTPQTPASWAYFTSCTTSKFTLTGLTSGQRLWVRVRAVGGTEGHGPWSEPADMMVP